MQQDKMIDIVDSDNRIYRD